MMKASEQKKAAKAFAEYWKDKGYEKGESQKFWLSLLRSVFGVEEPEKFIEFENQVLNQHMNFIDAYIPASRVMIEQKSSNKDLRKGILQSDGTYQTPFQQAQRYIPNLPLDLHPRYIITCNFQTFLIYDMQHPLADPHEIKLANLERDYYQLAFITEGWQKAHLKEELELSVKSGELVGKLYDALLAQYKAILGDEKGNVSAEVLRDLNKLCVRLVFCFYAEDAGILGHKKMFQEYLGGFKPSQMRKALIDLFNILDTPEAERDPLDDSPAAAFPYVNGGLFANSSAKEVPPFTEEIVKLMLDECCSHDWSKISPTIFGAVFESTLNPETRRSGGMHYTSIENIHKVIDPLFLDDLREEFDYACSLKTENIVLDRLRKLHDTISKLSFFDPACGSGNFLTETYISLRRLENDIIRRRLGIGGTFLTEINNPIRVSIGQFYGIEINDFAVSVARTALWIAESQMMQETESILDTSLVFLPLKTDATIVEGNALRLDWKTVAPPEKISYIMGNPPFVGYSLQSPEQKEDMLHIYTDENGKPYKTAGKIDYVAAWYFKTAEFMQNTNIRAALVSTNSITQGEQVASVWKPLYDRFGIHIDFAHRTFRWDSEASLKAHVHCVIVGFSVADNHELRNLYDSGHLLKTEQINPYLISGPLVFIGNRTKPLCDVPEMRNGNRPLDGGNLIIEEEEYNDFIKKEPNAIKFIKRFMMGYEFINNKNRWCLWLVDATPKELNAMPLVMQRVQKVKEMREQSTFPQTRELAAFPTRFRETLNPERFIAIPKVSSEQRRYVPMGYLDKSVIPGDKLFIIENATLYEFGVLTSNVHMAWMRAICGRLKSDYSYSNTIVYNNFPWPMSTPEQKAKIEQTARAILDARAKYPDSSLADLYKETTMPPELRKAHQENDKAVMTAYGFDWRHMTESDCVAELFKMYEKLVAAQQEINLKERNNK